MADANKEGRRSPAFWRTLALLAFALNWTLYLISNVKAADFQTGYFCGLGLGVFPFALFLSIEARR